VLECGLRFHTDDVSLLSTANGANFVVEGNGPDLIDGDIGGGLDSDLRGEP
jgi:hypothetical protein